MLGYRVRVAGRSPFFRIALGYYPFGAHFAALSCKIQSLTFSKEVLNLYKVGQGRVAELVDAHALGACGETRGGSSPLPPTTSKVLSIYAAVIQLVECHLAKVDAIGSNPIRRSNF
jgi:hypothetical protein